MQMGTSMGTGVLARGRCLGNKMHQGGGQPASPGDSPEPTRGATAGGVNTGTGVAPLLRPQRFAATAGGTGVAGWTSQGNASKMGGPSKRALPPGAAALAAATCWQTVLITA